MSKSNWISEPASANPNAVRLLCFPYAGGGTTVYHRWQRRLPSGIVAAPVALPGREHRFREPAVDNIQRLIDQFRSAVDDFCQRPSIFFGHSMGALIAYATLIDLRRRHLATPLGLIVSSCPAPQLMPPQKQYHELDDEELLASVIDGYDLRGDAQSEVQLMRLLLPTIRADFTLFESYRHEPTSPLELPIAAVGGADDTYVVRHQLEAWREQAAAGFKCRTFAGRHFYLQSQEEAVIRYIASTCQRFIVEKASGEH